MLQIYPLHSEYDKLQKKYGDPILSSIYGAGCIRDPNIMFIFMNPTGRNVSSSLAWKGIRAPWLGTKQVWDIFHDLGFLPKEIYSQIKKCSPQDWNPEFSHILYSEISMKGVYITNLAKCTQTDARPLSNRIFKEYLDLMYKEIEIVNPCKIITFGNQVSSLILGKNISVSNYGGMKKESLLSYDIYPTYYPVGQGRRNMPLAIERIRSIL